MTDANDFAGVMTMLARYKQRRNLEEVVWALLLGDSGEYVQVTPKWPCWTEEEIQEHLNHVLAEYQTMKAQVEREAMEVEHSRD